VQKLSVQIMINTPFV